LAAVTLMLSTMPHTSVEKMPPSGMAPVFDLSSVFTMNLRIGV
jgi:hypothetical protein